VGEAAWGTPCRRRGGGRRRAVRRPTGRTCRRSRSRAATAAANPCSRAPPRRRATRTPTWAVPPVVARLLAAALRDAGVHVRHLVGAAHDLHRHRAARAAVALAAGGGIAGGGTACAIRRRAAGARGPRHGARARRATAATPRESIPPSQVGCKPLLTREEAAEEQELHLQPRGSPRRPRRRSRHPLRPLSCAGPHVGCSLARCGGPRCRRGVRRVFRRFSRYNTVV
jgi:hypothetical protein